MRGKEKARLVVAYLLFVALGFILAVGAMSLVVGGE